MSIAKLDNPRIRAVVGDKFPSAEYIINCWFAENNIKPEAAGITPCRTAGLILEQFKSTGSAALTVCAVIE